MKFLCLAYLDRGLAPGPDVAAQYGDLGQAMRAAGVAVDSGQLAAPTDAKVVRITDEGVQVTDGSPDDRAPSAYFVIDCADLPQALEWAARIPAATYGSIAVRPPR